MDKIREKYMETGFISWSFIGFGFRGFAFTAWGSQLRLCQNDLGSRGFGFGIFRV